MFYVRQGMTIQDLAYLGRWKSNAVLRYAEEALETQPVNLNYSNREEVELLIRQNKRNKGKAIPVDDDEEKTDEVDLTMEETEAKHPPPAEAASVEVNPLVKKQEVDLYVKTSEVKNETRPQGDVGELARTRLQMVDGMWMEVRSEKQSLHVCDGLPKIYLDMFKVPGGGSKARRCQRGRKLALEPASSGTVVV